MPDSDFLMKLLPSTTDLDYLVHHRGYTHTFLVAPIMGWIAAWISKKITKTPTLSRDLYFFGVLGALFHVGADFMNSYGVHPFSPISNRWVYGDAVFIVEPLLWFILIPFIAGNATRLWSKLIWWGLGFGMLLLVWNHSTVDRRTALVLTAFFGICVALFKITTSERKKAILVTALFSFMIISFFAAGSLARSKVKEAWTDQNTSEHWLDTSSSPLPGNPFCWSTWITTKTETQFIYRSASVGLWPSLMPVEECGRTFDPNGTAALEPISFQNSNSVQWKKVSYLSIRERDELRSKSPSFRKLESFARFLYIRKNQDGSVIAGDLRYDRSEGIDFADAFIPVNEPNLITSPHWDRPLER